MSETTRRKNGGFWRTCWLKGSCSTHAWNLGGGQGASGHACVCPVCSWRGCLCTSVLNAQCSPWARVAPREPPHTTPGGCLASLTRQQATGCRVKERGPPTWRRFPLQRPGDHPQEWMPPERPSLGLVPSSPLPSRPPCPCVGTQAKVSCHLSCQSLHHTHHEDRAVRLRMAEYLRELPMSKRLQLHRVGTPGMQAWNHLRENPFPDGHKHSLWTVAPLSLASKAMQLLSLKTVLVTKLALGTRTELSVTSPPTRPQFSGPAKAGRLQKLWGPEHKSHVGTRTAGLP